MDKHALAFFKLDVLYLQVDQLLDTTTGIIKQDSIARCRSPSLEPVSMLCSKWETESSVIYSGGLFSTSVNGILITDSHWSASSGDSILVKWKNDFRCARRTFLVDAEFP